MTFQPQELTRLRLGNLRISAPTASSVQETIRWLVAAQAQDFAGAKWSTGLRMQIANDDLVENAFAAGQILRTHLLRPTWHFVVPEDIRWLLALSAPRIRKQMQTNNQRLGIDTALSNRAINIFERALSGGKHFTRDELREVLQQAGIDSGGVQRMAHIVMLAELQGVICSGPRKGKQFTYALLEERVPPAKSRTKDESLVELAQRFFTSRWPATLHDFARWSGLAMGDARRALDGVKHLLQNEQDFWLPADAAAQAIEGHATHVLSIFDEYLSSYADKSVMIDPAYVDILRALSNGLLNVIVVGGQVVGSWRKMERAKTPILELNLFRALSEVENAELDQAVQRYTAFVGKEFEITQRTK